MTEDAGDTPRLTTWIRIAPDNTVTVLVPHCEMGTGVHTALAMMLAEELDADWARARRGGAALDDYANGYLVRVFLPIAAVGAEVHGARRRLRELQAHAADGRADDGRQQRRPRDGASRHARRGRIGPEAC